MIALPFIFNTLINFVISLIVAKFLGPAEYGRYAIAMSIAIVLQTIGFDWLRLAATRFTSDEDRVERPEIAATLTLSFVALTALAGAAALIVWAADFDLPPSRGLIALAVLVAVANGLFDLGAALLRARFLNRAYRRFVAAKTLFSALFVVGGAYWFRSAPVALLGLIVSVLGSAIVTLRDLIDPRLKVAKAEPALIGRFGAYALPIVLANVLFQGAPLMNRSLASNWHGFAEAGELALAYDLGVRIIAAIGSTVDVLLFQLAVRAEKTEGGEAGRGQVARNVGLVVAVVLPSVAGCWLILPSFEHLFIPEAFRGAFGRYFTLMLPAFLSFALTMYCVGPIFQIAHKTLPLVFGGAAALASNAIAVAALPQAGDASMLALAQSASSLVGFAACVGFAVALAPTRPDWRDVLHAILATVAMAAAVLPLRALAPGAPTLILQCLAGALVYGGALFLLDVGGARAAVAAGLSRRAPAASPRSAS